MDHQHYIDELEAQGYVIVPGIVDTAFCDEIVARIKAMEAEGVSAYGGDAYTGFKTLRFVGLLQNGEIWSRVATHPDVLKILRGVLGEDMLLSVMATAVIQPGEKAQPLHRDDERYLMPPPRRHLVCNTMWALEDFTAENGATLVVPDTHRLVESPDPERRYETIAAVMPKGSVCFVLGTTYHAGGANLSNDRRWALTINYCNGGVRQQYNWTYWLPHGLRESFSPELQALIGHVPGWGALRAFTAPKEAKAHAPG
jgi:ectoine hydroxylase-related dioxygenase (phytanoyl-CoA dioxygenase family)